MQVLTAVTLLSALVYVHGSGLGLVGSVDGSAVIAGPSGTIKRSGLAAVGPIAAPGAIITGPALAPAAIAARALAAPGLITAAVAPGAILAGPALGLRDLRLVGPGLAVEGLGLEGSGIEGQYIPDLTEKLYDDGSYKPGLYDK